MAVWKDIPGYEGVYQVSWDGRIRRVNKDGSTHEIHSFYRKKEYSRVLVVRLQREGRQKEYSVISLVASTFLGPCRKGFIPIHVNGLLDDNCVANIAYISRKEHGRRLGRKGRPVVKIDASGNIVDAYSSAEEAGRKNHMSGQTVRTYCMGNRKWYGTAPDGYRYEYDEESRPGRPRKGEGRRYGDNQDRERMVRG